MYLYSKRFVCNFQINHYFKVSTGLNDKIIGIKCNDGIKNSLNFANNENIC